MVFKLKDKEVKMILDALIFTSTPDIVMSAEDDYLNEFANLALKIHGMTDANPTDSVKLFGEKDLFETPELSNKLLKTFGSLKE